MAELEDNKAKINLRDIRSLYIIKRIFSFLYEKQKLKIIVYSKKFQKMYTIGIEDYKKESGKYKKGEKNGKGKEYNIYTNILIFDGEYKNGIRNGNGKEYDYNDKLEFEGEYKNGKRNGKGKEYYNNGKLIFEGEYLNGRRWKGKGYNINGNKEFEIKDGEGNIKEYYKYGKLRFEGEYKNGENNGEGKEYYKDDKLEFEGTYLSGKKMEWKRKRI